jgi:hypothetical protein
MMSQGPWPSSAGRPPPPAAGGPGAGDTGDLGPGEPDTEPDYALPPDPFRRGAGREAGDPDRPRPDRAGPDRGGPDRASPDPGETGPAGAGRPWGDGGRGGLSRRLVVGVAAIALASALVGGVLGGYVVTRAQGGTVPDYSLGPVPRPVTQRSAGSVAGLAARILPSVVMIRVDGTQGTGSGFVIRGGFIVTDNHVVTLDGTAGQTRLQVVLPGGQAVPARLVGRDTYSDIAVIRTDGDVRLPALPLGNSAGVAVGDPVVAFGAPLGLAGTVTSGIVSALNRPV